MRIFIATTLASLVVLGCSQQSAQPTTAPVATPPQSAPEATPVEVAEPVASAQPWKLVHSQGLMNFVYVDKAHSNDQDQYRLAIADVCAGKNICQVMFWNDEALIPKQLPMSDAQDSAKVAHWQYNGNTGLRRLLWSCKIVNDPSECF